MTAVDVACRQSEGIPAPECCQAPLDPAWVSARAYAASLPPGELPTRCPCCSSEAITELFSEDSSLDLFWCYRCGAPFSWRD